MIAIIDYGMGNLGSILNMFKKLNIESKITTDIKAIQKADKLLLPGVGAFDNAIKRIDELNLREVLTKKVLEEKTPLLGICLGMQLLTKRSDEGELEGLGFIPAETLKFKFDKKSGLKVPHMGWNTVEISNKNSLIDNLPNNPKYYFVHSYYVKVESEKYSLLKTNHGYSFDSAIQNENVYGVQFHPEKSHKFGMKIFQNFAKL